MPAIIEIKIDKVNYKELNVLEVYVRNVSFHTCIVFIVFAFYTLRVVCPVFFV
jgi:hypothetical protein